MTPNPADYLTFAFKTNGVSSSVPLCITAQPAPNELSYFSSWSKEQGEQLEFYRPYVGELVTESVLRPWGVLCIVPDQAGNIGIGCSYTTGWQGFTLLAQRKTLYTYKDLNANAPHLAPEWEVFNRAEWPLDHWMKCRPIFLKDHPYYKQTQTVVLQGTQEKSPQKSEGQKLMDFFFPKDKNKPVTNDVYQLL